MEVVNDELFYVMSFRNMLQEFRTVGLLVQKFGETDKEEEFDEYSKTVKEFEAAIFQEMKSRIFQINRRLLEMHHLLSERIG